VPLLSPLCRRCPDRYCEGVTYGELFLQNEYEMSCYNLDEADVADQRQRFALCEAEVGSGLTVQGYEFRD
jgi:glycyl-tRNA synthetase